ncbi:hypothetical protein BD408DRAFT_438607 [Parasitella parasitica]|nr:hypothetical protein BD408DRAFT_438607 [Parasitella parasitica]
MLNAFTIDGDLHAFLNGFPTDWQIQITALLCNTFPGQDSWTTSQVAGAASNILGNVKRPITIVGRAGSNGSGNVKGGFSSGKLGGQSYHAKTNGLNQSSENTFSRDKEGGKRNIPSSATKSTFCVYCGKRWMAGHSCPEYYASKKANGGQKAMMHVLSIKKVKHNKKKRHQHYHSKRDNNVRKDNNDRKDSSGHDEETNSLSSLRKSK